MHRRTRTKLFDIGEGRRIDFSREQLIVDEITVVPEDRDLYVRGYEPDGVCRWECPDCGHGFSIPSADATGKVAGLPSADAATGRRSFQPICDCGGVMEPTPEEDEGDEYEGRPPGQGALSAVSNAETTDDRPPAIAGLMGDVRSTFDSPTVFPGITHTGQDPLAQPE